MVKIFLMIMLVITLTIAACDEDTNTKPSSKEIGTQDSSEHSIKEIETQDSSKPSPKDTPQEKIKAPFEILHDVGGLKITVDKITNDDMLKIYITYENNSGTVYEPAESLFKIVADGKQEEHDTMRRLDFQENVLYEIENGVTYNSVLVFNKVKGDKFNLVFSVNYEDIRINNIKVP
jgi:hypothetical protein